MSVYNHRPMMPAVQSRIVEMLDAIRVEFDQLAQEAYMCKSQRDDFELKMNAQVQEMSHFQKSLLKLERSQKSLKEHYEEEIARLRQQLEQAHARGGQPHPQQPPPPSQPPPPPSSSLPPTTQSSTREVPVHHHTPPPPNLGPAGSNYFGGIMNNPHDSPRTAQQQPGLATPPAHHNQPAYPGYPPSANPQQQQQQHPGYPNGSAPAMHHPPSTASSQAPPPPTSQAGLYGGRMPTSPAPGPYSRQEHGGYGYTRVTGPSSGATALPGTPPLPAPGSSHHHHHHHHHHQPPPPPTSAPPSTQAPPHEATDPHQYNSPMPPPARPPSAMSKLDTSSPHSATAPASLGDIDPQSVPASMKMEGQDWFALSSPVLPRHLGVDLVHSLDHPSVVCCVKFSNDGRYMAAGCNRITYIYDVTTGRPLCALQDDSVQRDGDLYIRSVCFSPDGMYLATGAEDKQIRIWDIARRMIRTRLTGHGQDIYSLDFGRDGRVVVSGSGDRTVRIWSVEDGRCIHTLPITDPEQKDPGVTSVAVSPDGRLVAAGSLDKMVRVWDITTGQPLERLEGHKDSVYSVAFMSNGRTLVSGSLDKTIKLWHLGTDRSKGQHPCKMTLTGHKDFVLSVACTPDDRWIVSGSKDRAVQFWDARTGQAQLMLQGHKNSVISVAVTANGRPVFATGSGDNRARIWSYERIAA
ncbi:WD40 repeat-like protein [Lichtheimia hyalospora FSU 10163]|nr:WD40 repeat-like protein [Lichtheimia hyalospora FSU 10163]